MSEEQVWGVSVVSNEEDIIGFTISHLFAEGLDGMVIIDHCSSDRTPMILKGLQEVYLSQGKVLVSFRDNHPAFYQGKMMTQAARKAHVYGATWIVPFDADELFYCLADSAISLDIAIRACKEDVIGVPMFNHYPTSQDVVSGNPYKSLVWRHPDRNPLDKVIYRWRADRVIDDGHHRILSHGVSLPGAPAGIAIRHFSARGADLWAAKSVRAGKALAATDLDPSIGAHVRQYTKTAEDHGIEALKEHYQRWFFHENPDQTMVRDPAPYRGDL